MDSSDVNHLGNSFEAGRQISSDELSVGRDGSSLLMSRKVAGCNQAYPGIILFKANSCNEAGYRFVRT